MTGWIGESEATRMRDFTDLIGRLETSSKPEAWANRLAIAARRLRALADATNAEAIEIEIAAGPRVGLVRIPQMGV